MITQALSFGFRVGEITCPTRYFPEASSIGFARGVTYGLGVLQTSLAYRLHHWQLRQRSSSPTTVAAVERRRGATDEARSA